MGNVQTQFKKRFALLLSMFKTNKKASIAILGLDSSGKSSLVNLFRDTNVPTVPTLGFNVEEIVIGNTVIKVWDVGGQKEFISYWSEYVKGVNGLVFMIDIADEDRFNAAFEGFEGVSNHLKDNLPVLILLNKIDLIESKSALDEKVSTIKKLFKADEEMIQGNSYMIMNGKHFKSRIVLTSVKDDIKKMTDPTNNWTLQDSTIYSGFKWLLE